jgi:hypothetical protein
MLTFYFIDVEGGQSTLIVTPARQSMLIDTGYAMQGRDSSRILAAIHDAGLTRIDYLLITHFHADHDGGIVELDGKVPVGTFFDHGRIVGGPTGSPLEPSTLDAYNAYMAIRNRGQHVEPAIGTPLPLTGVEATWVSSGGETIRTAVGGAQPEQTPGCPATAPMQQPSAFDENPRSTGFSLRFGKFRFVDLGDLAGAPLFSLICPANLLGTVDLYLLPHHGNEDVAYAAIFAALQPRVAVVNNGPAKGGDVATLQELHLHNLDDVWQLHRAIDPMAHNFADPQIANLDTSTSYWLKATASNDGSFSVTNARTGETRQYAAH